VKGFSIAIHEKSARLLIGSYNGFYGKGKSTSFRNRGSAEQGTWAL